MTNPSTAPVRRPEPKYWGSFITSALLAIILSIGHLILGGMRLWLILPILCLLWPLVAFQGIRLLYRGGEIAGRFGDWIDAFVLLFLSYATFRYFTATAEFVARIEVLQIYAYASVFWIARYGFSRRNHAVYLLGVLLLVGLFVGATGFLFRFHPEWRPYAPELLAHYAPRFCGTYGCPNHFGAFIVMTLGILLSFCLFYRFNWTLRILAFYLAGMMIVSATLSMSRGTWLGLIAALLTFAYFLVRHGHMRWFWAALGIGLVSAGAIVFYTISPVAQQRISEITNYTSHGNLDAYVRVELARDALKISHDYPWLGTGPASFLYVHMRYQSPTYSTLAQYTHNDYLNLLADYGIVGAVIVLGFIICVTRKLFRHLGTEADPEESLFLATATFAWMALLIHSVVDFNFHIPANALLFFVLIGIGLRESAAKAEVVPGWFQKGTLARPLGIVILLLSLGLLVFTVRITRSYFTYFYADHDYGTRPVPAAFVAAQKAIDIDPKSPLALKYMGDLYRYRAANELEFRKRATDAQKAAGYYQQAAQLNSFNDELLALQGLAYDLTGRYQEAYLIHSTNIKRQPYNGYYRLLLGLHFWRRNMLNDAQKAFEVGAKCPHGNADNVKALNEINRILGERKIQEQLPVPEHAPTIP